MNLRYFAASAFLLSACVRADAQIAFGPIKSITGDSDIATNGIYFDGINSYQNNGGTGDFVTTLVGTTIFNALVAVPNSSEPTGTDGSITLSSDGGNFAGFGYTGGSAAYNYVLNQASDANNGVITIGSLAHPLTLNDVYQVQIFDSYPGPYSAHVDGNPAINFPGYSLNYSIGTFTAGATTFTFDYSGLDNNNGHAGFVSDVVVRDLGAVPEPSTNALLLGGMALLGLGLRRNIAQRA